MAEKQTAMQKIITLRTNKKTGLYDITNEVSALIKESRIKNGIASVYARGATAAMLTTPGPQGNRSYNSFR